MKMMIRAALCIMLLEYIFSPVNAQAQHFEKPVKPDRYVVIQNGQHILLVPERASPGVTYAPSPWPSGTRNGGDPYHSVSPPPSMNRAQEGKTKTFVRPEVR